MLCIKANSRNIWCVIPNCHQLSLNGNIFLMSIFSNRLNEHRVWKFCLFFKKKTTVCYFIWMVISTKLYSLSVNPSKVIEQLLWWYLTRRKLKSGKVVNDNDFFGKIHTVNTDNLIFFYFACKIIRQLMKSNLNWWKLMKSKAFVLFLHDILIKKVEWYKVNMTWIHWSWLTSSQNITVIVTEGVDSSWVSQRFILGLILFNIISIGGKNPIKSILKKLANNIRNEPVKKCFFRSQNISKQCVL